MLAIAEPRGDQKPSAFTNVANDVSLIIVPAPGALVAVPTRLHDNGSSRRTGTGSRKGRLPTLILT
jgi:hypothetical protein